MQKTNKLALAIVVGIIAVAAGMFAWKHPPTPDAPVKAPPPIAAVTEATPASAARYPVPGEATAPRKKILPSLNESDSTFGESLNALFGADAVKAIFNSQDLIRRIVVTTENAKEKSLPLDYSPIHPVPGNFMVTKQDGLFWVDPKNEDRYTPYVNLVQNLDVKKFAELYFDFYPLFQAAYKEVSAKGYFNDVVIKVVDHLLNAPTVPSPIQVVQLNKSFHYADTNIEGLSASQKIMIRMGTKNSEMVKEKLRTLRNLLILGQ